MKNEEPEIYPQITWSSIAATKKELTTDGH